MTPEIYEATALLSTVALQNNFILLTRAAGVDPANAFALVKANAYGHGVLFGDGQEQLFALSEHAETIPHEYLAGLTPRVKRVWVD